MKYQVFRIQKVLGGSNELYGLSEVLKKQGNEPEQRGLAEYDTEKEAVDFVTKNSGQLGKLTIIKVYE